MATIWERASHSVNRMFSLYLVIFYFGFKGGTLVLIASVPDHCLSSTFDDTLQPGSIRLSSPTEVINPLKPTYEGCSRNTRKSPITLLLLLEFY